MLSLILKTKTVSICPDAIIFRELFCSKDLSESADFGVGLSQSHALICTCSISMDSSLRTLFVVEYVVTGAAML